MAKFGCNDHITSKQRSIILLATLVIGWLGAYPPTFAEATPASAMAASTQRFYIELPPASIAVSLNRFAEQTKISIIFPYDHFDNIAARPVIGWYTATEALTALLKETGYQATQNNHGIFRLSPITPVPTAENTLKPSMPTEAPTIEEVWVRGYRESLHSALTQKRESRNLSDIIIQEDIGKFPDNNIAEALQRLTGVAIERDGGEGQFITVRGFGPEFNRVYLNGRALATDNQERGFSLDIIPADLISRAEVLKTHNAQQSAGSIGANLNLHTPTFNDFAIDEPFFRGRYQWINQPRAKSPTADVFATVGASKDIHRATVSTVATVSLSERNRLREGFTTEGFRQADHVTIINPETGATTTEDHVFIPRSYRIYQTEDSRQQLSTAFNITLESDLEWKIPWVISADIFISDYQTLAKAAGIQAYFEDTYSALTLDEHRTATAFSRLGRQSLNHLSNPEGVDAQGIDSIRIDTLRDTLTYLIGSRLSLEQEQWQSTIDLSQTEAKRITGGNPFSAQGYISEQDAPWQFNGNLQHAPNFYASPLPAPNAINAHFFGRFDGDSRDRIQGLRWDNTVQNGFLSTRQWRAGAFFERRFKDYRHYEIPYPRNCAYCGRINPFTEATLNTLGLSANEVFTPVVADADFAGGIHGEFPRVWYDYDIATLISILESDAFIGQGPLDSDAIRQRLNGIGFQAVEQLASYQIQEAIRGAYFEATWRGEIAYIPNSPHNALAKPQWELLLGSQYSQTTTTNFGIDIPITQITRANDDDQLNIEYGPATPISERQGYEVWLPFATANLRFDQQVLRAAYSHTITRPNLQDLGSQSIIVPRAGSANIFRGNIGLRPYRTQNFDGAYEKYFSENSLIGLNIFYKKLDRFVSPTTRSELFDGYTLHINSAQNQERAHIYGAELAFIHHFNHGVGIQFNHTWVHSSADFSENKEFAIEGLSPRSLNFISYIEQPNFALRLSYNWRKDYLQSRFNAQSQPQHSLAYGQWDFSSQWFISKNASLSAEIQNILEKDQHYYSIYSARVIGAEFIGRTFRLGLSIQTDIGH